MVYIPVLIVYRTDFSCPNTVLMNIMAYRVYKNTKFGLYKTSVALSTTPDTPRKTEAVPLSPSRSGTALILRKSRIRVRLRLAMGLIRPWTTDTRYPRITNDNF
jgi:hypothetical protein